MIETLREWSRSLKENWRRATLIEYRKLKSSQFIRFDVTLFIVFNYYEIKILEKFPRLQYGFIIFVRSFIHSFLLSFSWLIEAFLLWRFDDK